MKTILDIDWRTLIETPEWAAQVASRDRMVDTRVEVIDDSGLHLTDVPCDSLSVTCTGESTEQWSADLRMSALYPASVDDLLHPLAKNRVRVWWQEWLPALDGWGEVPLITGRPQDPSGSLSPGLSWTLKLVDTLADYRRGDYGGQVIDVSGMEVGAALAALWDATAPRMPRSIPETTVTLPSTYVLGSGDPAEDAEKIAAAAGWIIRSDRMGVATPGPAPAPAALKADWQEGPGCRVVKLDRQVKTSEIRNAIRVVSTSAAVVPPITATAVDDDPGSPTWVGSYGPYWLSIDSAEVATQEAADTLAATTLAASVKPVDSVMATATPRPDLNPGDLIALGSEGLGVAGTYRISGWRLDCPGGGRVSLMDVTMADH